MDEERMTRIAKNEALFRAVNDRVEGLNETFGSLSRARSAHRSFGRPT